MRLYHHFLRSFFVSDLVARGGDPRSLGIMAAAFFGAPGIAICMYLNLFSAFGVDTSPELAFFIALSLILTGLLAVVEWEDLFPGRTDILVLRPLPLPPGAIVAAKLGALATLLAGFYAIVNFYSNLMLPFLSVPGGAGMGTTLRWMGAQAAATAAAALWVFLAVVGLKGLVLALGAERGRWRPGPLLRFGLMVGLLAALILTPRLVSPTDYEQLVRSGGVWSYPLLWFVGLDKLLAGGAAPVWMARGRDALRALGWTALGAAFFYLLGCRRQFRAALASAGTAHTPEWRRQLQALGTRLWLPEPRQRAVFRFAVATLARSRRHRLYLSAWLGVGVAFTLEGSFAAAHGVHATNAAVQTALLAAPLVLCFFLLLGLRHVFTIPTDLAANWIFRLSETGAQPERLGAAPRLMAAFAVAPVVALTALVSIHLWGWGRGLAPVAVTAVLAVLLIEVLLLRFRKLPFTCAYQPGKANAKVTWVICWLAFTIYAQAMAAWEYRLWPHPERLALWLMAGALLAAALALGNHRWCETLTGCQFDDEPEALVQSLFARDT